MKKYSSLGLALIGALALCTRAGALPVTEDAGVLNFKDRFYALSAKEGDLVKEQFIVKGITYAPECSAGSITLMTYPLGGNEKEATSLMLWPRDQAVAEQLCALRTHLPLKYPLVTLSGKRLQNASLSLNGKEITSASIRMHMIPTAIVVDREDVR
jgi:hypothetical protein